MSNVGFWTYGFFASNPDTEQVPSFTANGVTFDGSSDYLSKASGLSNVIDGKSGTFSIWFRRTTSGTFERFLDNAGGGAADAFSIRIKTNNTIAIDARDSDTTVRLDMTTNATFTDTDWHHLLIAFDVSLSDASQLIYVDDVVDSRTLTTRIDGNIDFANTDTQTICAADGGAVKFQGDVAEFWGFYNTYVDISDTATRRKFITASGTPADLGATGQTPTGAQPHIFLSGDTSTWHQNKGKGGGFTENGALTISSNLLS